MSKMMVGVAAASALTFTTQLAFADEPPAEPKNRDTAFMLSIGGTLASAAALAVGVGAGNGQLAAAGAVSSLFTPAAGEIYAGRLGTPGLVLRLVSAGVAVVGVQEAFKCFLASSACQRSEFAGAFIAAGTIGYASGILYDIAMAGSAVDDYNQRLHLRVTPTVIPTASSGPAVGLGIGGSF
jgi:hypothetical protein